MVSCHGRQGSVETLEAWWGKDNLMQYQPTPTVYMATQHHGIRSTGKPVESSKEHLTEGEGGGRQKRPKSLRLIRDDRQG